MSRPVSDAPDELLDRFDRRVDDVRAAGDQAVIGAAVLDRGLIRFARGRFDDAVADLDEAAAAMHEAGYQAAAAVVASIASLVARVRGDGPGADGRALTAQGWAPPSSTAAVAAAIAAAEVTLDRGDPEAGAGHLLLAAEDRGEGALDEPARGALSGWAEWLRVPGNLARRRPTPRLDGARAGDLVTGALEAVLLGQAGIEDLEATRPAPEHDLLGHAAAGAGLAVTHFRHGRDEGATRAVVEAHLLGFPLPPA
jgi:hypothetical protein